VLDRTTRTPSDASYTGTNGSATAAPADGADREDEQGKTDGTAEHGAALNPHAQPSSVGRLSAGVGRRRIGRRPGARWAGDLVEASDALTARL
jgi:hypothetical protein